MKTKKPLPAFMQKIMDAKDKVNSNPKKGGKPFKNGGFVKAADGCVSHGGTKAKQIKMKSGGSC
jgi:hypothetical protein